MLFNSSRMTDVSYVHCQLSRGHALKAPARKMWDCCLTASVPEKWSLGALKPHSMHSALSLRLRASTVARALRCCFAFAAFPGTQESRGRDRDMSLGSVWVL